MADSEKTTVARPESPTTAKELNFDEDENAAAVAATSPAPNPPPKDEAPAKPPRPVDPREQAEMTLREAFPSIEPSVIRAVLRASGGSVEPAFNALLEMSDPEAVKAEEPPPRPARPAEVPANTQSQVDADEMYARQLHEHFSGATQPQQRPSGYNENLKGSRQGRPGAKPNPDEVPWRSFFDDDLPEIRDNIKKGFLETQSTVNKWLGNLKKKIDGEEESDDFLNQPPQQAQGYAPPRQGSFGRRSGEYGRRSADMQRYDADPEVIGDDFSRLEMRDDEDGPNPPLPERKSSRPLANPNLFKSSAIRKDSPSSGRKVSFQNGPPEEIKDMYAAGSGTLPARPASATKSSKWQPISTVDPSPVAENDPFSLGDSDEERDAKPITLKDDDQQRLEKSTQEAMADSIGADATDEAKK